MQENPPESGGPSKQDDSHLKIHFKDEDKVQHKKFENERAKLKTAYF